jgi:hypothetical protein
MPERHYYKNLFLVLSDPKGTTVQDKVDESENMKEENEIKL